MKESQDKNKSKKSGSNTIGILGSLLAVSVIAGVMILSSQDTDTSITYFNKTDANSSEELLSNLTIISEENYPKTPEEVVDAYLIGYKLLYGEKILDEKTKQIINYDIVQIILESQRYLLSEDLKELNPLATQVENVIYHINNISSEDARIIDSNYSPAIYSSYNPKLATVRVSHIGNGFTQYFQEFEVEKDFEDKWRITRWYNTDENYNALD